MFDTMVFTKVVGAFCGALLVFLLGQWAAESLYSVGGGHGHGHGEQAYVIDTGAEDDTGEPAEEAPTFEELFRTADASAGSREWNQCRACHALEEGENKVGPYLHGVVGREVASVEGFNYSDALPAGESWSPSELSEFIAAPSDYAPGTSMGYAGLDDPEARANLIAYIIQESGQELSNFVTEAPAEDAATDAGEGEAAEGDAAGEGQTDAAADGGETEQASADAEQGEGADEGSSNGGSEFAQLVAAQDPADGEQLWNQCRACHALEEGVNRVGPSLYDIIGREVGTVEGFSYSGALSEAADVWTVENISALIENPRDFAPGSRMGYAGMGSEEDRAKLIAYLQAQFE